MPTTRKSRMRLLALGLPLLAFLLSGCASQFPGLYPPDAATSEGVSIRNLYDIVFIIAAVIFFLVEGLIIYAVIRYRRRPTDTELPPQIHGNNLIEIVWTVVPTVIVLFMFVVSWQTLNTVEAKTADPTVRIVAVANRFSWDFIYVGADGKTPLFTTDANGDGVFGSMEVPPGVPIEVQLHSPDVIHAFYVPKFLFKRDVVPGQTNVFDFTVDPGDAGQTFRGQCAELCGVGHYTMVFEVHASNSMADYQAWLQQQIANTPPPAPSGAPGASGAPGGSAAPPASGAPGASGAPPSGAPPAGSALTLEAKDVAFVESTLETAAGQPFQIAFTNSDAGVQHNIEIKKPDGSDAFKGQIVTGVTTVTYDVSALAAGSYEYNCTVHPTMTGTLTVK